MYASHWHWILFANVLLGASQSLTWSMTVVMKIDIAADNQRGLAIGFNEFAGYGGVAVIAFLSGFIASEYDLRPQPFYLGIVLVLCGMILCLFVKDTRQYALSNQPKATEQKPLSLQQVFYRTTWLNPSLSAASLAGLVTNLKDGMLWGLLPFFLSNKGLDLIEIGIVAGIYPVVWSIAQLKFGPLSDRIGRKPLIVNGMAVQGLGIVMFVLTNHYIGFIVAAALAGLGTAMVYPTLLALVADKTEVNWRASALGIYRFWRDLGYAVGALSAGLLADYFGISIAMQVIAVMTFITSYIVFRRVDNSV
jgi:MFS family permease